MKRITPYLKMRVLGAIEFAPGNTIRDKIKHVSTMVFTDEEGEKFQFTWRTISTWNYRYKKGGITTIKPKPRSDKGRARKIEPEKLLEAIEQVKPFFHGKRQSKFAVYRACIERGFLSPNEVSRTSFCRFVNRYDLFKPQAQTQDKRRLAFAKAHANEMWQADTMFGPYVKNGSNNVQTKLIAFIDDASRVCCHGEFFLNENTDTLIKTLRSALYKRGVPEAIYVDNGSIYTSKEISQICTRLGCLLCHAPVRDGAAKGKVERFFRTVRQNFLSRSLDLSSLEALNRAFSTWVEDDYNARKHSTLGMRPIDRFGLDLSRIRYLPPNEVNDELFFVEEDRTVLNDNTFSFKSIRFEAPRDLRQRKIQIRYNRLKFDKAIVYYKGERMGQARRVDFIANDRKPKKENSK